MWAHKSKLHNATIIGFVEFGLVVLVTLGVAPKLFNTLAALLWFLPVVLLNGDVTGVSSYYLFVLAFHIAASITLLVDAWDFNGAKAAKKERARKYYQKKLK